MYLLRCKICLFYKQSRRTIINIRLLFFKAIPHKVCASDAQSDFLSDETKNAVNTLCIHEAFCEIWRKICKQMTCRAVRRALCGIALNIHFIEKCSQNFLFGNICFYKRIIASAAKNNIRLYAKTMII